MGAVTAEAKTQTTSCGLTAFSSAWVSSACECEIDSTIYIASTTKTKKHGTTVAEITKTIATATVSNHYMLSYGRKNAG